MKLRKSCKIDIPCHVILKKAKGAGLVYQINVYEICKFLHKHLQQ